MGPDGDENEDELAELDSEFRERLASMPSRFSGSNWQTAQGELSSGSVGSLGWVSPSYTIIDHTPASYVSAAQVLATTSGS